MAYGITNESQIIDLNAIISGCNQYKEAISALDKSGSIIREAGETCNEKALSVDGKTLESTIIQIGTELERLKLTLQGYADQVISDATQVYNAQVAELKAYQESLNNNN